MPLIYMSPLHWIGGRAVTGFSVVWVCWVRRRNERNWWHGISCACIYVSWIQSARSKSRFQCVCNTNLDIELNESAALSSKIWLTKPPLTMATKLTCTFSAYTNFLGLLEKLMNTHLLQQRFKHISSTIIRLVHPFARVIHFRFHS